MVIDQGNENCLKTAPPDVWRVIDNYKYVDAITASGPWLCLTDGTADGKQSGAGYFWKQFKTTIDPDYKLYVDMQMAAVRARLDAEYEKAHPLHNVCTMNYLLKPPKIICKMKR